MITIDIRPSLFLGPNIMPLHVVISVGRDGHQTIYLFIVVVLPLEVASKPRHGLPKIGISVLNFEARLIHINHILCPNVCLTQRIVLIPEYIPLVLVYSQV